MLIGELSRQTGLSRDTIRYYEKIGLISSESSDSPYNNYRSYNVATTKRIEKIRMAKFFGFSLREILTILDYVDNKDSLACADLTTIVKRKLLDLEQQIKELEQKKLAIQNQMNIYAKHCSTSTKSCSIVQ